MYKTDEHQTVDLGVPTRDQRFLRTDKEIHVREQDTILPEQVPRRDDAISV